METVPIRRTFSISSASVSTITGTWDLLYDVIRRYTIFMASIHMLPGKPNWYCSLKLANDKRTFKSTGLKATEKNRAAALSLCEQWQRIENGLSPKTI